MTVCGSLDDVIIALHNAGLTASQISQVLGKKWGFAIERLGAAGIQGRTRVGVTGLDLAEMARAYQTVQSGRVVGEIFHASRDTVITRLKEYGQPVRSRGGKQLTTDYPDASPIRVALTPRPWERRHQQIVQRLLQGHSAQQIMNELAVSAYEVDQSIRAQRSRDPVVAEIALRAAHGESVSRIAVMMGIRVDRVAVQVAKIRKGQKASPGPRELCASR
ncbi:hypothetical protein ACFV42_45775 [Streptomyces solisilvae]|uniref:hypothetical protein n=1 Tax=Streptomyces malaysiensis TaxID=92644 RepID=UPI0036909D0C